MPRTFAEQKQARIFHEASANKQIFAKQGYQKFVREDALSLNVSTRNERAYNASPIKIRKRISSGRALSVRIIKNKKTKFVSVGLEVLQQLNIYNGLFLFWKKYM